MTAAELTMQIKGHVGYIERYRPLLLQIQCWLFFVGFAFYFSGITFDALYTVETWGDLLYRQPSWFWGAFNMAASATCIIALLHIPNCKVLALGQALHIVQTVAITVSCIFYGGDIAIGLWSAGFVAFHAKIFVEAVRCR